MSEEDKIMSIAERRAYKEKIELLQEIVDHSKKQIAKWQGMYFELYHKVNSQQNDLENKRE